MAKTAKEKKKFTIEFSPEADAALDDVAHQLGASKVKIVRDALSLYVFLADEVGRRGRRLAIVSEQETLLKIVFVPGLRQ